MDIQIYTLKVDLPGHIGDRKHTYFV